jgi:hypothetical protein
MSKSVRIRRGSSLDHLQFAGAEGEITVDTTLDTLRVHDGDTLGGWPLLNSAKNSEVTAEEFKANKILYKNSYANQAAFPSAATYPGMLVYSQADSKAYISTGTVWSSFTQPADLTSFVTGSVDTRVSGADYSLLAPKIGTNLVFKTLRSGTNITVSSDSNSLTIASAAYDGSNKFDSSGTYGVYKSTVGTTLGFRGIRPGSGLDMSLSVSQDEINIDTKLKQAFNTVKVGATNIVTTAVDNTLEMIASSGISLTGNATNKTVTMAVNLSATNDVAQTGSNVLASYSAGTFVFNKIKAGTGVELSAGANGEITVSAPQVGTVTGGENLGVGPGDGGTGIAIFESSISTASTLKFRRIRPGAGIVVTMSGDQEYMDISSTLETPGGAGAGVVNIGDQYQLAYYPNSAASTTVGPTPSGISINTTSGKIVADIDGTVSDISNHDTDSLEEGSVNQYWTSGRFDTAFGLKTTTSLTEGTQLYFTADRAQDAAADMLNTGNPSPTVVTATTSAVSTSTGTVFVGSSSGIVSGMVVTGATISSSVTVTVQTVSAGQFTVSPAIYAPTGTSLTLTGATTLILNTTAAATSTATLTVNSTAGISTTWYVTGTGISGATTVSTIGGGTTLTVSPGYNVTVGSGVVLTFAAITTNGVAGSYIDGSDSYTLRLDPNYVGQQIRSALSVIPNQGLSYDPVQGRFGLSGAVTQVNGYSGSVTLTVGDITGAAPLASPVFTGSARVPDPISSSNGFQITNKNYVDAAKLAVTGNPLAGLATIQALGNAINGDALFYQTVTSSIATKLSSGGGTMTGLLNLNYTLDYATSNEFVAANKKYVDQRSTVQSVNTLTGNVVLTSSNITEGSRLYYTDVRARNAISLVSNDTDVLSYSSGVFSFNKPTTDGITEGSTNQYWLASRSRGAMGITVTGNTNFASYSSSTGVYTINANTDNLSQGSTNRFFTQALARSSFSLSKGSTAPEQALYVSNNFLNYNDSTGIFTILPSTDNLYEGTKKFYTDAAVRQALTFQTTSLNTVSTANSIQINTSTGVVTFNANTNNIVEGTTNLYHTPVRVRTNISLTTDNTQTLSYDSATGVFTYSHPTTDRIAEGTTNKYYADSLARSAHGVTVTTSTGVTSANHMTYSTSTGVYTINANIDSMTDGATNKFASLTRVAGLISLAITTTNGGSAPAFLAYNNTTGAFTFNNSTDSLTEGTVNKWASDATVRAKLSVNSGTQTALSYSSSTGVFTFAPTVSSSLVYTASPTGGQYHFSTAQDLTTSGKPQFVYVTTTANPTGAGSGSRLAISGGEVSFNCAAGQYHEVARSTNITQLSFTNVPAVAGQFFEIIICFYNTATNPNNGFTLLNTNIKWAGASRPDLATITTTSGRRDVIKLFTIDGGTTWIESGRSLNIG